MLSYGFEKRLTEEDMKCISKVATKSVDGFCNVGTIKPTMSEYLLIQKVLNQILTAIELELVDLGWNNEPDGKTILDERLKSKSDCEEENEQLKKHIEKITKINSNLKMFRDELVEEYFDLRQFQSIVFEIVDAFIKGIESEKGIDENNERFQYGMDRALDYMKRLKEELEDPSEFLKMKEWGYELEVELTKQESKDVGNNTNK